GALPPGRRVRQLRVRQVARGGVRADGLRVGVPQALLSGAVPREAHQRAADGLLPRRGPRQRHEAPRRLGAAGDINASSYRTTTEWVGRPGEPLPPGAGISARPEPIRSPACVIPSAEARERWTPEVTAGWGVRLGLHLVKGIGEQHQELLDAELARGPYGSLADVVERTDLPEEVLDRLIRTGGLDSLGRPRRELLWQLRELAGRRTAAGSRSAPAGRA